MKGFLIKYWKEITIVALLALFFITLIILLSNSGNLRKEQKEVKVLVDSLHKDNVLLIKELKITKDSIQILHSLAISTNSQDTVYVNQIKYLKTKTNEEVNSIFNNSIDSNLSLHARLSEEYRHSGSDTL